MYPARELILKKRDGVTLTREEIEDFVAGICDHTVTDAQLAAFAMATWFRGMDSGEKMALTLAMRDSGTVLAWDELHGPVLDKHSTGGVGDSVSLILGPVIAACGGYVPMISGRGLAHTGGTLDKLESIPGVVTALDATRLRALVRKNGLAIAGQSSDLVPADRRLYAVRDETGTVSSVPLIVSSILSKKLAEGLDALVLDIKFGHGAFMEQPEDARQLAKTLCDTAQRAGLRCAALLTDMNQPLARSAGNALEVREAIAFLKGEARHEQMQDVVLELCAELLCMGGLAETVEAGRARALDALDSGAAAERFAAMVTGQGGPARLLEDAEQLLPKASVVRPVTAESGGYVTGLDARAVGMVVVQLGGGRLRARDAIDPAVGLSALCQVGARIEPETPLAMVHAASETAWQVAAAAVRKAIRIGPEKTAPGPVVRERLTGG